MKLTKTQLISRICELDPAWLDRRGRLYYMSLDELEKLYERIKHEKKN